MVVVMIEDREEITRKKISKSVDMNKGQDFFLPLFFVFFLVFLLAVGLHLFFDRSKNMSFLLRRAYSFRIAEKSNRKDNSASERQRRVVSPAK